MRDRNHTYGSSQSNLSIYEHLRYLASSTSSLSCLVCYLVAIPPVLCNDHLNTACIANTRPAWNEKCTMVVLYTCHDYRCINSVNILFQPVPGIPPHFTLAYTDAENSPRTRCFNRQQVCRCTPETSSGRRCIRFAPDDDLAELDNTPASRIPPALAGRACFTRRSAGGAERYFDAQVQSPGPKLRR